MESPWKDTDYDPSLAFMLWAWGEAAGFSNGKSQGGGEFDHRRGTLPFLLDRLARGNPWQADPTSGRAPVDWLWSLTKCYRPDFLTILEACLTHPAAPDPKTWSIRPIYRANHDDRQGPAITWIRAMASHPHGPDAAGVYVRLGGRLDALDGHGQGLLANCSTLDWPTIEKFMAAAQTQAASLLGAPEGQSWSSSWHSQTPTDMARNQAEFSRLSEKYPAACQSGVSPVDEMLSVIRQASGMRPTSAAWKRLDMEKHLRARPDDVVRLQAQALALGASLRQINATNPQCSTLSYLAGRLAKLANPHQDPRLLPGCRLAAALAEKGKHANEFALLAQGICVVPEPGVPASDWLSGLHALLEHLPPALRHVPHDPRAVANVAVGGLLEALSKASDVPAKQLREIIVALTQDPFSLSTVSHRQNLQQTCWAGTDHAELLLALDARAAPDLTSTAMVLDRAMDYFSTYSYSHLVGTIIQVAAGQTCEGGKLPSWTATTLPAAQHFVESLPRALASVPSSHPLHQKVQALAQRLAAQPPASNETSRAFGAYLAQTSLASLVRVPARAAVQRM